MCLIILFSAILLLFPVDAHAFFTDYASFAFTASCEKALAPEGTTITVTYHSNGGTFYSPLEPGLYETGTDTLLKSWDTLLEEGLITVSDTALKSFSSSLAGDVLVPDTITSIGDYAAEYRTGLTGLTLPETVTTIGYMTFRGCSNLQKIVLPKALTSVDTYAFYRCSALTEVYYTGTEDDWSSISFESGNTALTNADISYEYAPEAVDPMDSIYLTNAVTYTDSVLTAGTYLEPTHESDSFGGWYLDEACSSGNEFIPDEDLPYTVSDLSVYAKWNNLIYEAVEQSASGIVFRTYSISGTYDTTRTITPQNYTGYITPSAQTVVFDTEDSKTITFVYEPITYQIVLDPCGGTLDTEILYFNIETEVILPTPARENYAFCGWYESSDFSGDTISVIRNSTKDRSYYAKWNENISPVLCVDPLPETTFDDTVTISGSVSDDTSLESFVINGVSVPVDETGAFTFDVSLSDGEQTLEITVSDIYGNTTSYVTAVHKHEGSAGLSYANGCYQKQVITSSYCAGHYWSRVYEWSCGYCGTDVSGSSQPSSCPNMACWNNEHVTDNWYPHSNSGTDYCSSSSGCSNWIITSVYELECPYTAPPVLTVNAPRTSHSTSASISGTVSDISGNCTVNVNGTIASVDENGYFAAQVSLSKLINTISISASNAYGSSTVSREIIYEAPPGFYAANSNTLLYTWEELISEKLITVSGNAATDCYWKLEGNLSLSHTLTSINSRAFEYCSYLKQVLIPDSVTSIGDYAFSSCEAMTHIRIPESVTEMGIGVHYFCKKLQYANVPKGIAALGKHFFYYCYSMTEVSIPASVTSIGDSAFSDCTALEKIYYEGSEEDWSQISIGSTNDVLSNASFTYNAYVR